jgi:hypothetical protein
MSRLGHATEVTALASDLGLGGAADPVEAILGYCRARIGRWVAETGGVADIAQLEALVTRRLQMVFEEVRSDDDFDRITQEYARAKKDPVFATMRLRFDDDANPTYGALVMRRNVAADAPDRYVAVIDCRGDKLARRFFTRWHETAHRLTTHADRGETLPTYRFERDPIERLMDEIAGEVGFYGPLFDPVFGAAHQGKGLLTFETIEAVRQGGFPEASFQATLNACARRLPTPVVYLEAAIGHKKKVREQIRDARQGLFGKQELPEGQLRAVKVVGNQAAYCERFVIPTNMRVPQASLIHQLFTDETEGDAGGQEDLCWWESQGKPLDGRAVAVEGRRVADRVIAIVQPVEPVRPKPKRPEPRSLFGE